MPFKSTQQRKFMFARKPEIAKKWAKKYGIKPRLGAAPKIPQNILDHLRRKRAKERQKNKPKGHIIKFTNKLGRHSK
jgi:hypothetical protein